MTPGATGIPWLVSAYFRLMGMILNSGGPDHPAGRGGKICSARVEFAYRKNIDQISMKKSPVSGPYLTGPERQKIDRAVFKRDLIGPSAPEHLYGKRRRERALKAFYAAFVGPRLIPGTKAYQRVHSKKHYRNHRSKSHAQTKERRAAKDNRTPPWFGEFDQLVCEEAYALLPLRKAATGIDWHVDHMLPLRGKTVSGLHVGNNLAVIPAVLNCAKSDQAILTETGAWLK